MTREETKSVMVVIGNAFPTSKFASFDREMLETWTACLSDIPFATAKAAVLACLMTADFPPSIAQIRSRIAVATMQISQTPDEAWGKIMKAVRKFGWCNPKGAEEFLGAFTWGIVTGFEWRYFCELDMDKESTYFAQFRTAYNTALAREKEKLQIPQHVQELLGGVVETQGKIGDGKDGGR